MGKNYYEILGLSKHATEEDIKRSFRTLALKFHPDKNPAPGAAEKFQKIAEAYDTLIDKNKREAYDQTGENQKEESYYSTGKKFSQSFTKDAKNTFAQFFGSSSSFQKFFDISTSSASRLFAFHDSVVIDDAFKNFAGFDIRHGGRRTHSFNMHGNLNKEKEKDKAKEKMNIEHDLYVSLEDVMNGCTKKVKVSRVVFDQNNLKKEDKIFTINVKPGWKSGTKIIFKREGNQSKNEEPSDVIFVIKDKPHPNFKREGSNLRYSAKITLQQALCGCEIVIPTLSGEKIKLNLKDEILRPQISKKLCGLGLPHPKELERRGDMIVTFDIKFPSSLPKYVKNILEELLLDRY